ncbi:MAG: hypothetical protein K8F62_17895 [Pseudorhodoplanes sp.]|nr:hypothetical protein [Pseudorhodoplanes sp.]
MAERTASSPSAPFVSTLLEVKKMKRALGAAGGIMLALAGIGVVRAQQQIEWKQTINVPKGQTLSRDRADILGIELGDTYAEAKAKLQKLYEEVRKKPPAPAAKAEAPKKPISAGAQFLNSQASPSASPPKDPVREEQKIFRIQSPGASTVVTASFAAKLVMERELQGTANRTIGERVTVFLSAPASGQQVLGIERSISYRAESDQPRVSELLAQLKQKMKANPQVDESRESAVYVYQFNDGQPVEVRKPNTPACPMHHNIENAGQLQDINRTGNCDAVLRVQVNFGISRDHAKYLNFILSDNDRTKANVGADFAFVEGYIRSLQERARGAPPKL